MQNNIQKQTQVWLYNMVAGLNLCPFSHRVLKDNSLRMTISETTTIEELLSVLISELELLDGDGTIETTLIIIPDQLHDFMDYLDALSLAEDQLAALNYEGIYQIASFHPEYQFEGSAPDDVENFTNRSPYPMFHLLREASLDNAIDQYPDVDEIPVRNMALLKSMGITKVLARAGAEEILEKD
jgi:hypothetical protein